MDTQNRSFPAINTCCTLCSVIFTISGVIPLPDRIFPNLVPSPAGPTVEDTDEDVSLLSLGFGDLSTVIISEVEPLWREEDATELMPGITKEMDVFLVEWLRSNLALVLSFGDILDPETGLGETEGQGEFTPDELLSEIKQSPNKILRKNYWRMIKEKFKRTMVLNFIDLKNSIMRMFQWLILTFGYFYP